MLISDISARVKGRESAAFRSQGVFVCCWAVTGDAEPCPPWHRVPSCAQPLNPGPGRGASPGAAEPAASGATTRGLAQGELKDSGAAKPEGSGAARAPLCH